MKTKIKLIKHPSKECICSDCKMKFHSPENTFKLSSKKKLGLKPISSEDFEQLHEIALDVYRELFARRKKKSIKRWVVPMEIKVAVGLAIEKTIEFRNAKILEMINELNDKFRKDNIYFKKDVKEFIKILKEKIRLRSNVEIIDKLAGKALK